MYVPRYRRTKENDEPVEDECASYSCGPRRAHGLPNMDLRTSNHHLQNRNRVGVGVVRER